MFLSDYYALQAGRGGGVWRSRMRMGIAIGAISAGPNLESPKFSNFISFVFWRIGAACREIGHGAEYSWIE